MGRRQGRGGASPGPHDHHHRHADRARHRDPVQRLQAGPCPVVAQRQGNVGHQQRRGQDLRLRRGQQGTDPQDRDARQRRRPRTHLGALRRERRVAHGARPGQFPRRDQSVRGGYTRLLGRLRRRFHVALRRWSAAGHFATGHQVVCWSVAGRGRGQVRNRSHTGRSKSKILPDSGMDMGRTSEEKAWHG